jgi:hypothetical protein
MAANFFGLTEAEPVLLRIASSYEKASRHWKAPSAIPRLKNEPTGRAR